MKKTLAILILSLTIVCSIFAFGRKDEFVVDLGYVMPTSTNYNLEDSETYSKVLSNGIDIGFRSYDSGLFGSYFGCDILWPHKTTNFVANHEISSTKFTGYDSVNSFDFQVGIYSPMLDFGFLKLPFGAGVHCNFLTTEVENFLTSVKNSSLDIGFAAWAKAELQLAKNIGLYVGVDFAYDMYQFTWSEVGSKSTNDQNKVEKIGISPSIGVSIRF